jgi:long-chain acyl-CoA synthetase
MSTIAQPLLHRVAPRVSPVGRLTPDGVDGAGGGGRPVKLEGPTLAIPAEALASVPGLLLDVVRRRGAEVALRTKGLGVYRDVTWNEVLERISRIGLGLCVLGVEPGDRVAIVGDPSADWLLCDFAAQCIGAISYGLYPTSSREEAEYVLRHGGARVLIAEDQEYVDKVLPSLPDLPSLTKIVVIDMSNMFGYDDQSLMSLDRLMELGERADRRLEAFIERCRHVRPDDDATIVYTSGTSAHPKGAVYTHRALVTQGHQFFAFPELARNETFRSVVHLPLNHLYERMNTPMGMLTQGIVPHVGDEVERFTETLHEVAPQHHASVPRYWSKLASRVIVGIENSTALKRASYAAAMHVARRYRERRWNGRRAIGWRAAYGLARVLVFDRMLKKLGLNRVRLALSAGAPLPAEVQALWQCWGVNLKNLFGQTEGGVLTAQVDPFPKPGSVGTPYPGVEIGLGDEDEIVARSPGCFDRYWLDPDTTAETLCSDGLHTGDVGMVDEQGQLWIVDRRKDIVITAGGKNVSPSRIETALKSSPYVSEASAIGEGRKFLTALIEIDVGTVSEWARANGVSYTSYRSLATNEAVNALIERELQQCNRRLGRVEQIKKFRILDRELDPEIEGEAVTPTRKIKRALLQEHFRHLIDEMYEDDEERRIGRQIHR